MTRVKKVAKGKKIKHEKLWMTKLARESPFEACKKFMIDCIIQFYNSETTMSFDNKYIIYGEDCPLEFKADMYDVEDDGYVE